MRVLGIVLTAVGSAIITGALLAISPIAAALWLGVGVWVLGLLVLLGAADDPR